MQEQEEKTLEEQPTDDRPSYGYKRYEIVDELLERIAEEERMLKLSPVEAAAIRA